MFTEIIKDKWENKNKNDKAAIELWNSKADYFGSYELENVQNERFIQIIKENNLIDKDSFILDSAMDKNKLGRYSFISSNPFKVLKYKDSEENPLNFLQEELRNYKVKNDTNLPFIGGAVGYLSYDLGNYMENLPRSAKDDLSVYDLYFGLYDHVIVVDHLEEKTYIATPDLDMKKEEEIAIYIENKKEGLSPLLLINKNCYKKTP